ncbi:hypothetical protein FB45DRAFT_1148931 [Roridomyces roridus]|uniref:BTB domain-containing protein n=1 Tax=Roridomyces roridus TaxID=1738132 RepID=A0AAD7BXU2_9AGAR|nr:hypothetical protein FB45DRAFT_1148931 [Roridomyces roridus]
MSSHSSEPDRPLVEFKAANFTPQKNEGNWENHPFYWFADGSIVLRIESTLYKIHRELLLKISEGLSAILTIPTNKAAEDPDREGTEQVPLLVAGLTNLEFEDFLRTFVYRMSPLSNASDDEKERMFTNLLKISDLYIIAAGKDVAVENLDSIYLPPTRKLQLACEFRILKWIEPAVKSIISRPIHQLTTDEAERVGFSVYRILVQARDLVEKDIKRTAHLAPPLAEDPSWECADHKSCVKVWRRFWREEVGWKLLHPTTPMKLSEVWWTVKTFEHQGLTPRCLKDVADQIRDGSIFFEDRVVGGAAHAIIELYAIP